MVMFADVAGSDFLAGIEWFFFGLFLVFALVSGLVISLFCWLLHRFARRRAQQLEERNLGADSDI